MADGTDVIHLQTINTPKVARALDKKVRRIIINVSGTRFVTTIATLQKFPNTQLGQLLEDECQSINSGEEIFFDADDDIFREVLRYHRTGELHTPSNMCAETFSKQLKFWGVDTDDMEGCCQDTDMSEEELEKQFMWFEQRIEPQGPTLTRSEHIWYFLTDPQGPYTRHWKLATAFTCIYMAVTVAQLLNLAVYSLNAISGFKNFNHTLSEEFQFGFTHPCEQLKLDLQKPQYSTNWIFQEICFVFFFWEILFRIISCPNKRVLCPSIHLLDLIVISFEMVACVSVRALIESAAIPDSKPICLFLQIYVLIAVLAINFRSIRLVAFATVFSQLRVLLLAIWNSKKDIALLLSVIVISCLVCGPMIYFLEIGGGFLSPNKETNLIDIPTAYWWTVVTMTTVGYGDFYPTTLPGYIYTSFVMLQGLIITALPVAIIGGQYAILYDYNQKREKRKKKEVKRKREMLTDDEEDSSGCSEISVGCRSCGSQKKVRQDSSLE